MRISAAVLVFLALSGFALSSQTVINQQDNSDSRIVRVERWLKALLLHEPGVEDEWVSEVGGWSNDDLRTLWVDEAVFALLMRDPRRSWFTVPFPGQRNPVAVRYTPRQLHRLKVLACAAGGMVAKPVCLQLGARSELDAELMRLADLVTASNLRGDENYVLRRGALLHTDVAMFSRHVFEPLAGGTTSGPQQVTVWFSDGRETSMGQSGIHWDLARSLLDRIAPAPARDSMVWHWYRATAAWMHSRDYHDMTHLARARGIFPDDANLLFLSGCERETFARPALQAAAHAAALPSGFRFEVGSERAELSQAERLFRRAIALDAGFTEARLHLGHVLLLRGRHKEAVDELRPVVASADENLLQYYGLLFLGAAEEGLGNRDSARASYRAASELFATAQSPHLALSALARRRGDRASALAAMQRVFDLPRTQPERDDPWWTYHLAQGRYADLLLEELRQPFVEAAR